MTSKEITDQLQEAASSQDFMTQWYDLTDKLESEGAGLETVEPILRFMEDNPSIDFGTPGPLVHFVERFYKKGYEEKLIESVRRRPVSHTVWMINRLINGAKEPSLKREYIEILKEVRTNPLADEQAIESASHFLERFA